MSPNTLNVVVLGTGRMAPGITIACVAAGAHVLVVGRNRPRAHQVVSEIDGAEAGELDRTSFAKANIVVETIVEDFDAKARVLWRIEPWLKPDALLVSNTSSLSIDRLAEGLCRPERFAGLHFLYPAHLTPVVEVVPGRDTSAHTIQRLKHLVTAMAKKPLTLRRDCPGFLWNRLQFALLRECLYLLDAGVADIDTIDSAVADGLAPRWLAAGPLATADLGGLDTFHRAAIELFPVLSRADAPSASLVPNRLFYAWTPTAREAVERLRSEILELAFRLGKRRPTAMPSPASNTQSRCSER